MEILKKVAQEYLKSEVTEFSVGDTVKVYVKIVEGDERNIKVTTPMDLMIAQHLLEGMQ